MTVKIGTGEARKKVVTDIADRYQKRVGAYIKLVSENKSVATVEQGSTINTGYIDIHGTGDAVIDIVDSRNHTWTTFTLHVVKGKKPANAK